MQFAQYLQTYFERSEALQWYWTLYVVIIGGLLAFSSLRRRPDVLTAALVTILFACFAYKNLGAIQDTTRQRQAIITGMRQARPPAQEQFWQELQPALAATSAPEVRNFHLACDLLTIATVWAMEWRRWRRRREAKRVA